MRSFQPLNKALETHFLILVHFVVGEGVVVRVARVAFKMKFASVHAQKSENFILFL